MSIRWSLLALLVLASSAAYGQTVVNHSAPVASNTTSYPFIAASQVQTWWEPSQLGNPGSPRVISEFGTQFISPISFTWASVTIYMGETSATQTTMNTTFDANWLPSTKTLVYQGPITVNTTTANEHWRVPLQTNYTWSGTNGLMVHIINSAAGSGTGTVGHCADFNTATQSLTTRLYTSGTTSTTGFTNPACTYGASFVMSPLGPTLTVSATAGTAQTVFANEQGAGGSGIEAGMFTIDANNQTPACTLTNIELTASGTGDDSTAFSEVRIYRDHPTLGTQGVYDPADEFATNIDTFTTDDGVINFTVETAQQGFSAPDSRDYFVVVKMASSAQPGDTFDFTITDITVAGAGLKSVPAGATMTGLIIDTPQFVFTDTSPTNVETVFLTFTGVCQVFTVGYPNGPDDKPASINVNGLGTADESTDLVNAQLWWDSDNDTLFDDTLDTQVDTQVFTQDNGLVSFSLATLPDFQAGDTRRFFVVYLLNTSADDQETFQCYISDMGAAPLGGAPVGLPTPSANGTPGLEVSAAILFGIMYGPAAPLTVDSNAGDVLLADVGLDALPGGDWGIDTVTFNAGGTGNHNSAYAELALYEDTNNNGTWDGAGTDTLAAPIASGFVANSVSFDLTLTTLLGGDERRFFLVAAYNGTAAAGETFGARLTGFVAGITPPGGSDVGFPTPASTAVVIDVAVLSVANGPNQPEPATHAAGAAGSLVAASFRLNALNGATTVNGIDLTASGTGDWSSDVDSASGVQIYHDDGDGVFDAGTDSLLAQAGGAALVTATFTAPLNLAVGEIADLWVVIGLTATAGQGIAATPETFSITIANTTDVSASAPVEFGMPAPNGITVGAIEFSVTNFDPVSGLAAGGQALIISGSGFMAPFTVTIGGTPCLGTAVIAGGTQVTGLTIPPGFGDTLPIVVQSGDLPPQTLTQTFTYTAPKDTGGSSNDEGGSCSTGTSSVLPAMLAMLALLAALALRRRRST